MSVDRWKWVLYVLKLFENNIFSANRYIAFSHSLTFHSSCYSAYWWQPCCYRDVPGDARTLKKITADHLRGLISRELQGIWRDARNKVAGRNAFYLAVFRWIFYLFCFSLPTKLNFLSAYCNNTSELAWNWRSGDWVTYMNNSPPTRPVSVNSFIKNAYYCFSFFVLFFFASLDFGALDSYLAHFFTQTIIEPSFMSRKGS